MTDPARHTIDIRSWINGTHSAVHRHLGAHPEEKGVYFGVWAPNARRVNVIGDFNGWDPVRNPLQKDEGTGIWSGTVKEAGILDRYKYAVHPAGEKEPLLKADPVAFRSEPSPGTSSVVEKQEPFSWSDGEWMAHRDQKQSPDCPIAIYEVHLGSWQRDPDVPVRYADIADRLLDHVEDLGFTHIELLPLAEHPYGASWGYQVTGFFAPTARYGSPAEFRTFVDRCHGRGIGVILDLVPGHFPADPHGLVQFDGSPLFEHPDPRRSEHPDWGTVNVDFEKGEVRSFMISNACYWCREFHIDGLRIDAVASMLYLDYSRQEGEWLPNEAGGREHLGAVRFLREMNRQVHRQFGGILTIAEESTAWPGVTAPVAEGGLGFDFKWNMGWMNDTLRYFSLAPEERLENSHALMFPLTWAFDERFILPFSHDEVVHLKKSLWGKMPGSDREKTEHLRTLFLFWTGSPGKKLLFMGSEWGQRGEWSEAGTLEWHLLDLPEHRNLKRYVSALMQFYRKEPGLSAEEAGWDNFRWIDRERSQKGVFSFLRMDPASRRSLLFIFNFSSDEISSWRLPVGGGVSPVPVFQTEIPSGPVTPSTGTIDLPPRFGIVLEQQREEGNDPLPQ